MSSPAITTVIAMMESLPENAQERVAEHLREYIADLEDEMKWDTSFKKTQQQLINAARRAKQEMAEGKQQYLFPHQFQFVYHHLPVNLPVLIRFVENLRQEFALLLFVDSRQLHNSYESLAFLLLPFLAVTGAIFSIISQDDQSDRTPFAQSAIAMGRLIALIPIHFRTRLV